MTSAQNFAQYVPLKRGEYGLPDLVAAVVLRPAIVYKLDDQESMGVRHVGHSPPSLDAAANTCRDQRGGGSCVTCLGSVHTASAARKGM